MVFKITLTDCREKEQTRREKDCLEKTKSHSSNGDCPSAAVAAYLKTNDLCLRFYFFLFFTFLALPPFWADISLLRE